MARRQSKSRLRRSFQPEIVLLEDRVVLSTMAPTYVAEPAATPSITSSTSQLSPAMVRQAYGFNQINFTNNGQTVAGDGRGETIAIVDAYDDPNIVSDLHTFDQQFGLADPPSMQVVNQTGGTAKPSTNATWGVETSLDVEWAHAIAPGANILLIEANSDSNADLLAAVDYARNASGVVAVSMSWGSSEFSGEANLDSHFVTPSGHIGVTFIASTGDNGSPAEWPAVSTHVLAVGGTTLNVDSSGNWLSETGWSGSGGGLSTSIAQPSYQKGIVTQSSTQRGDPDVAYDGDANTGFLVYDSFSQSGWLRVGGTSAGAPQWAALIAIADQGLNAKGLGSLDSYSATLPDIYQLPASDFHDVTSGSNGGYTAGPGYDLVTGRGSPIANKVVADLVGSPATAAAPTAPSAPTGLQATAGSGQITLSWTAVSGATSYNIYRGTSPGGEASTAIGQVSGSSFTDTGLANGTAYYYKITAVSSAGESARSTEVTATPKAAVAPGINIDAGGGAVGTFVADTDFSGGSTSSVTHAIDTSGVTNPAPQSVYQTWRYSDPTYTIPNLTAGATYTVRLDFAEDVVNAEGQRVFNVSINGKQVLTNFDVFKAAGDKMYKAVAQTFTAIADSAGRIVIKFTTVTGNSRISGIEISPAASGNGGATAPATQDNNSLAGVVSILGNGLTKLTTSVGTATSYAVDAVFNQISGVGEPRLPYLQPPIEYFRAAGANVPSPDTQQSSMNLQSLIQQTQIGNLF